MTLPDFNTFQAVGGMRDVNAMVYDCSLLDKIEGIRFRGRTIPDLVENIPKAPDGEEPLPEGVYWLLLTGNYSTQSELAELQADLKRREALPQRTID